MKGDPRKTAAEYLARIGRDRIANLGPNAAPQEVTASDEAYLKARLVEDRRFNNLLLISAVILLYAIFALAAILMWHYRDKPTLIATCFGGSFFSLTLLVHWLRRLWIDKNFIDLIIRAMSQLSPLEVAKLISTHYELMVRGKGGGER